LDNDGELKTSDQMFLEYKEHFKQMTKRIRISTYSDVYSITISEDERRAIVIIQAVQDKHMIINQYDLHAD